MLKKEYELSKLQQKIGKEVGSDIAKCNTCTFICKNLYVTVFALNG